MSHRISFGAQSNYELVEAMEKLLFFGCKECEEKFTSESDLKIHQIIAHPSFKFACGKCDKQFISERSLNLHLKVVHQNKDLTFNCDKCDKTYTSKHGLKKHILSTHEEIRWKCDFNTCNVIFASLLLLLLLYCQCFAAQNTVETRSYRCDIIAIL